LACATRSGTDTTAADAETICARRHSRITAEASFIEVGPLGAKLQFEAI
jgi:hypothetical protein